MKKVKAYSDGACSPNPGPGGWGFAIYYETENCAWRITGCKGKKSTTNNEMELTGAIEMLEECPINSDITAYIDSEYVLGGLIKGKKDGDVILKNGKIIFSGWIDSWIKNKWKKSDGKDVKNIELWKLLVKKCEYQLQHGSTLRFMWVKGHSGIEGNEIADKLAQNAIPNI